MTDVCLAGVVGGLTIVPVPATLTAKGFTAAGVAAGNTVCLCFLFLVGVSGRIPISDVSAQGKKVVVTTSMAHFLRKRACPKVTFAGTSVPDLEASGKSWTIKALSLYQVTLHGDESTMPLDTSTGHLNVKFPQIFLSTGMWHCPLIWWCLFFLAASAGAASKLTWPLTLLLCFGIDMV